MKEKSHHLLSRIWARFHSGSFDEADVASFIIFAREESKTGTTLRDLGDFVAHRTRNRGPFLDYLNSLHKNFAENPPVEDPDISTKQISEQTFAYSPMFSAEVLAKELNEFGNHLRQPPLQIWLAEIITLMTISLLQGVRFVDETSCEVGSVMAAITHHRIVALARFNPTADDLVLAPLVSVPNRWYTVPVPKKNFLGIMPNNEMEVECKQGVVRILSS